MTQPRQMDPVHALRVAGRFLDERRQQELARFERGLGPRAQATCLQRIADLDEVTNALVLLEQALTEREVPA